MKQNPPKSTAWPPLIEGATLPWYVHARDILLTAIAWIVVVYMLGYVIILSWDFISHPFAELTYLQAPDWDVLWGRIYPFLVMSLLLMMWIWLQGRLNRKRLRQVKGGVQPAALTLEQHASFVGIDPVRMVEWRTWPVIVIEFDDQDQIMGAHQGEVEPEKTHENL